MSARGGLPVQEAELEPAGGNFSGIDIDSVK